MSNHGPFFSVYDLDLPNGSLATRAMDSSPDARNDGPDVDVTFNLEIPLQRADNNNQL